jgi:inhibitor of KinA sporulation pathway (predicted exonuclease)
VQDAFYTNIDPASCVRAGLKMDISTIMWWMQQSEDARAALNTPAPQLWKALEDFTQWIDSTPAPDLEIWGNGANFDNVLLAAAYDACGLPRPWKHYQDRCYRTLKCLHPDMKIERSGTHHNALDDARCQAEHLIRLPSFQAMCDREEVAA